MRVGRGGVKWMTESERPHEKTKVEQSAHAHDSLNRMSTPLSRSWTQDEHLTWASSQEGPYEFDGFQPVAMTGGTINHSMITQNVQAALRSRLHGSGCRPLGPDLGMATVGTTIRYPDALVTCSPFEGDALTVPGVVVIFEVLRAGTSRTDRIIKMREYAAVASIRR